jgi:hypothetical protein
MNRPRRRQIFLGLFTLALGAATTVGVSWGLACMDMHNRGLRSDQRIRPERGPIAHNYMGGPADGISVKVFTDCGRIVVASTCYGPDYQAFVGIPIGDGVADATEPPDRIVPVSVRSFALPWLFGDPWPRGGDEQRCEIQASGWPFIALLAEHKQTAWFTYQDRFGIALRGTRSMEPRRFFPPTYRRLLPLCPLFPGFALDTLVFALLWFLLLYTPNAIRVYLRRTRHQCPHCAYDLCGLPAGSPCPECGPQPTAQA